MIRIETRGTTRLIDRDRTPLGKPTTHDPHTSVFVRGEILREYSVVGLLVGTTGLLVLTASSARPLSDEASEPTPISHGTNMYAGIKWTSSAHFHSGVYAGFYGLRQEFG